MNNHTRTSVFVFFLLLMPVQVFAGHMKIMTENYPPYSYQVDDHAEGFVVDIVRLLMGQVGEHSSEIVFYPWPRAYQKLRDGSSDVLFPMARTPEREKFFKFVGPVFSNEVHFYRKKGSSINIDSFEDAKKVGKISVTRDDLYHQFLKEKGFTNLDVSSCQRSDFRKLLKGYVDLVPMGDRIIREFLKEVPDIDESMFEKVGPCVMRSEGYIAFAAHIPDGVVLKWQKALDGIKKGGAYQLIIDSYFEPCKEK
ncbi:MAG: transporter substrate-binding domain-containing protein [Maridesulfovibrio ferrireducens]|nr:transporter substrate-binding domain-containing protein [Maridesulfovibrio ferrireducens]